MSKDVIIVARWAPRNRHGTDGPGWTRRTGQGCVMPKWFLAIAPSYGSLKRAAEGAGPRDEDASSDKTSDQIADPTAAERDAEEAHKPTRDGGSYDAK